MIEEQGCANLMQLSKHRGEDVSRDDFRPKKSLLRPQVNHASQLDNETLTKMAILGDSFSRRERLLREIMQKDSCSWDEANDKLIEIDTFNEEQYWTHTFPYRVGISAAFLASVFSTLMVFNQPIAKWYAVSVAGFVGEAQNLPDGVDDVDSMTVNQVGSWTWNWMEPMIGVASFVLLCCQFTRAQCVKLNLSPYTEAMLRSRANRVVAKYSNYDASMVRAWAKRLPPVGYDFMPKYRRHMYAPEKRRHNFRDA
jgi:hypothetical protein